MYDSSMSLPVEAPPILSLSRASLLREHFLVGVKERVAGKPSVELPPYSPSSLSIVRF